MARCDLCVKFDDCPFRFDPDAQCSEFEQKPMTNADKVRQMNDEELADFIHFVFATGANRTNSSGYWREWLKQTEDKGWAVEIPARRTQTSQMAWRTKEAYEDALDALTWYNCLAEDVLKWPQYVTEPFSGTQVPILNYCGDKSNYEQLQAIWVIAVSLFGDWGTSPRSGWIEDVEGFHKWVKDITETYRDSEEANDENGSD